MRLIDADALIKRMKAHTVEGEGLDDWYKAGLTDSIRTAVDLIENAPTIERLPIIPIEAMCSACNLFRAWRKNGR